MTSCAYDNNYNRQRIQPTIVGTASVAEKKTTLSNNDNEKCAICMDTLSNEKNFAKTNCQHSFCLSCLVKALKVNNQCPLCRSNIEDDKPKNEKALTFEELVDVSKEEIDMFPWKDHLDAILHFDTPQTTLKNMLRVFSIGLARSILVHQEGDEDDYEEEEEEIDYDY